MKIPIVLDRKLKLLSDGIIGITLYPFILINYSKIRSKERLYQIINHEKIHIEQQKELLVIFFYLWYVLEWAIKFFKYGSQSYYNISFEREAYKYDKDLTYLDKRKRWAFLKFL